MVCVATFAITEVVHNPATGWNVHYHVVLLLDRALDQPHLRRSQSFPRRPVRPRCRAREAMRRSAGKTCDR